MIKLTYRQKHLATPLQGCDLRITENMPTHEAAELRMNQLASYTPDAPRKTRDFTYFCYQIGIES